MDEKFGFRVNGRHGVPGVVTLTASGFRRAQAEIRSWPGYAPTSLRALPELARQAGIGTLHIKDESERFGLGSFKALGGSYAVLGTVRAALARAGVAGPITAAGLEAGEHREAAGRVTVCCATDGNHGRSVAWGAKRFGARCVIFVHEGVAAFRVQAMEALGAEVRLVPGTYDDAVRHAAELAEREGWDVISDTSWPGYTEVPREVMQGYRLMADEALDQLPAPPTHVFVQAGVGGLAAAVAVHMRTRLDKEPVLAVVEACKAPCLLESAEAGEAVRSTGALDTNMAGLACGEPSLLAWQELERSAAVFLAVPDASADRAVALLEVHGVRCGESGAAGLAGLLDAAAEPEARRALGLGPESRVLLFGTEGQLDRDGASLAA